MVVNSTEGSQVITTPSVAKVAFPLQPGVATEMNCPGAGLDAKPPGTRGEFGSHPDAVLEKTTPNAPLGVVHCPNQELFGSGVPEG